MNIKEMCLQLPIEDRVDLCRCLQQSIITEKRLGEPMCRAAELKRMMAEVLCVEEIPIKNRKSEFTWARNMIAHQLVSEGMTELEAARFLDKDRSQINYMRHRVDEALKYPRLYSDVIYIWKQFQDKIHNETNRGSDQEPVSL